MITLLGRLHLAGPKVVMLLDEVGEDKIGVRVVESGLDFACLHCLPLLVLILSNHVGFVVGRGGVVLVQLLRRRWRWVFTLHKLVVNKHNVSQIELAFLQE